MKKLLLSLLFSAGILTGLFAQSLSLADSAGPIAQGATVTIAGNSNSAEMVCFAFVKNNSSATIPVKVRKAEIHVTPGAVNTFCWGLCFAPNVFISTTTINIGPGVTDSLDFSAHLSPLGYSGYTLMKYVFYDETNPDDSVSFYVNFAHYPLGVNDNLSGQVISQPYPNPANEKVSFDFNIPSGTGKIIIRNLLGSTVKEMQLNQSTGNVQLGTADLPEGIYFYTLSVNGKAQLTRKLVVRH